MTEREALRLLKSIHDLTLLGYPYAADNPPIDINLLLAFGQIGGIASKAIPEHEPLIGRPPVEAINADPA
jgi:hypothetical protein